MGVKAAEEDDSGADKGVIIFHTPLQQISAFPVQAVLFLLKDSHFAV